METDFVDQAVEGWNREIPRLKTESLEITGRLERIARHLDRRASEALTASGLSCRDLEVLGALRRSGGGMPAGQLAKAAMLTSGGMTGQADRLANAGLVVRRPDPADRRAVLVSLTPEGEETAEGAVKAYLKAGEQALEALSEKERAVLAELLRKLLVGLEGPAPAPDRQQEPGEATMRANQLPPKRRFHDQP